MEKVTTVEFTAGIYRSQVDVLIDGIVEAISLDNLLDERVVRRSQAKVSSRPRLKESFNPAGVRLGSRGTSMRTKPLVVVGYTIAGVLYLDKLLEERVKIKSQGRVGTTLPSKKEYLSLSASFPEKDFPWKLLQRI